MGYNLLLRPIADISLGGWTTQSGGTANLYSLIDDSFAPQELGSPACDSDYIQAPIDTDNAVYQASLPATPSDFGTQDYLGIRFRYLLSGSFPGSSPDKYEVQVRVLSTSGSAVLAALNSAGDFQPILLKNVGTEFHPLIIQFEYTNRGASKTRWDNAYLEIKQAYTQNGAADNRRILISTVELHGRYTPTVYVWNRFSQYAHDCAVGAFSKVYSYGSGPNDWGGNTAPTNQTEGTLYTTGNGHIVNSYGSRWWYDYITDSIQSWQGAHDAVGGASGNGARRLLRLRLNTLSDKGLLDYLLNEAYNGTTIQTSHAYDTNFAQLGARLAGWCPAGQKDNIRLFDIDTLVQKSITQPSSGFFQFNSSTTNEIFPDEPNGYHLIQWSGAALVKYRFDLDDWQVINNGFSTDQCADDMMFLRYNWKYKHVLLFGGRGGPDQSTGPYNADTVHQYRSDGSLYRMKNSPFTRATPAIVNAMVGDVCPISGDFVCLFHKIGASGNGNSSLNEFQMWKYVASEDVPFDLDNPDDLSPAWHRIDSAGGGSVILPTDWTLEAPTNGLVNALQSVQCVAVRKYGVLAFLATTESTRDGVWQYKHAEANQRDTVTGEVVFNINEAASIPGKLMTDGFDTPITDYSWDRYLFPEFDAAMNSQFLYRSISLQRGATEAKYFAAALQGIDNIPKIVSDKTAGSVGALRLATPNFSSQTSAYYMNNINGILGLPSAYIAPGSVLGNDVWFAFNFMQDTIMHNTAWRRFAADETNGGQQVTVTAKTASAGSQQLTILNTDPPIFKPAIVGKYVWLDINDPNMVSGIYRVDSRIDDRNIMVTRYYAPNTANYSASPSPNAAATAGCYLRPDCRLGHWTGTDWDLVDYYQTDGAKIAIIYGNAPDAQGHQGEEACYRNSPSTQIPIFYGQNGAIQSAGNLIEIPAEIFTYHLIHIKINGDGTPDSICQFWIDKHDGNGIQTDGPWTTLRFAHFTNGLGQIMILPFNTNKCVTQENVNGYYWIDDLWIGTQPPILLGGVGSQTPPPPPPTPAKKLYPWLLLRNQ